MGHIRRIVDNTKNRIKRIDYSKLYDYGIGFWIFMILIFVFGIIFISNLKNAVNVIVNDYGYTGIFVTSILADILVQPVGPEVPLVIGILFGLDKWIVLLLVIIGSYVALLIAYYVGKTIGAAGIEYIIGKRSFAKLERYKMGPRWFMFIGALTPIPYIPYLAGLWQFNLRDVILYVALPRTIRFIIVFLFLYFLGIKLV